MEFYNCETLDFNLKGLGHFTELQNLEMTGGPSLLMFTQSSLMMLGLQTRVETPYQCERPTIHTALLTEKSDNNGKTPYVWPNQINPRQEWREFSTGYELY